MRCRTPVSTVFAAHGELVATVQLGRDLGASLRRPVGLAMEAKTGRPR